MDIKALRRSPPAWIVALLCTLPLWSCGAGAGDSNSFGVRTTANATLPDAPLVVGGNWIVYFASEAFTGPAGSDFNADGDTNDDVAVVVRASNQTETVLQAAFAAAIVANEIYIACDEADSVDLNGDLDTDDLVLLHWNTTSGLAFVDTLDSSGCGIALLAIEERLVYASAEVGPGADDTTLRVLESSAPTTPVVVENEAGAGTLHPRIAGEDAGLVFLHIDESEEGADKNGDSDSEDEYVLALLDGTSPAMRVKLVGLAQADDDSAFGAIATAVGDWDVAFLVDEDAQEANLNFQDDFNQPLVPNTCLDTPDIDELDEVLFVLDFLEFCAGLPALSSGLAGRERVVIVDGFAATLQDEADATCDLNEDGDELDTMVRWVGVVTDEADIAPPRDATQMEALEDSVPGGAQGLASLSGRFVALVDEAADGTDIDLDGSMDHDLIGWLDPADGPLAMWTYAHERSGSPTFGTGIANEPYAGATWMAAESTEGRLGLAFPEEIPDLNLNTNADCGFLAKDSDETDSLPVWLDFEVGPTLDFDGVGFAVDEDNTGVVVAQGFAFYRVDEAADATDYNNDLVATDFVLMRNPTTSCDPVAMATSTVVPGLVITTDGVRTAAFLSDEFQAGLDLNEDGDFVDLVVRYFQF